MISAKFITRFSSWQFICLCIAGLLWQLVTITAEYFKYKVTTSTIIFTPNIIEPTAMTICFNLFGLLNLTSFEQDLNIPVEIDKNTGNPKDKKIVNDLTVRQLFDYTPSNNSIIEKMTYKLKNQSRPIDVPKNMLSVFKFFRHANLCYKIQVKNSSEYLSYRENSISNFFQFVSAQLFFTKLVDNARYISPIVSYIDQIPYQELISTRFINRRLWTSNGSAKASSNAYASDHMTWERTSLPSPYETQCTSYEKQGFHSRDHCINDCTASQVWKTFGKVSLMSVVTEPSDSLQVNRILLEDKQSFINFSKILNNCEWNKCKNQNCHERRIFTTTYESSIDEGRRIRWHQAVLFSQLSVKITSRPTESSIEIVIFVLGSISTWTGLSIMTCNPAALARLVHKHIRSTSQIPQVNNRITDLQRLHRKINKQQQTTQRMSQRINQLEDRLF